MASDTNPDETYDEWYAKLTDEERRWVAMAIEEIGDRHYDPAGLVPADMASPDHALLARWSMLHKYDREWRPSHGGSLNMLRASAAEWPDERAAYAMDFVDRVLAASFRADDILNFVAFMEFVTERHVRVNIDDAGGHSEPPGWPGGVMMERVDGEMSGRVTSGGERFKYNRFPLAPWPEEYERRSRGAG